MNQFYFSGRYTKDPEVSMSGDIKIAKFSIAVDRRNKDKTADFFNLTAFAGTADFIDQYCKKGMKMLFRGHVNNNNYEKDGRKIYQNSFIVDECEFCESKKDAEKEKDSGFVDVPEDFDTSELPFN